MAFPDFNDPFPPGPDRRAEHRQRGSSIQPGGETEAGPSRPGRGQGRRSPASAQRVGGQARNQQLDRGTELGNLGLQFVLRQFEQLS